MSMNFFFSCQSSTKEQSFILLIFLVNSFIPFFPVWLGNDSPQVFSISPLLSYTNFWLFEKFENLTFDKCPFCKFPVRNRLSNSQSTDYIMTIMINNAIGIIPLARSIRTTGCKAKFVVFIDDTTLTKKFATFEYTILRNCAVNCINVGEFKHYPKEALFFFRFYIYYDFLNSHTLEINRVVLIDGHDVLFQGDPFYEGFTNNDLIFTYEDRTLNQSVWGKFSYKNYFFTINKTIGDYARFYMVNAGIILGGRYQIHKFIEVFIKRLPVSEALSQVYKPRFADQAVVHSIIYDKEMEQNGINVTFSSIYDEYTSITLSCFGERCIYLRPNNYTLGYFQSRTRHIYPFIIHQYNRYPPLHRSYISACPNFTDSYYETVK